MGLHLSCKTDWEVYVSETSETFEFDILQLSLALWQRDNLKFS